jgi:hypothetical protein
MRTGTCDVCHETTPFADHLAETTARCERCGQGRVHVAAATGITASIPDRAEDRINTPPDTAVTDRRPSAPGEPPEVHHPAPGTCPRCGSAAFKQVKAKQGIPLKNDRECKGCGKLYTTVPAPLSSTVQAALYVSGALLILGVILPLVLARLIDMPAPGGRGLSSLPLWSIFISLIVGYRMLSAPWQTQQLREKRLREYRTSAPLDTPPPVEIPLPPDMVFLSVIFGWLALASPLVASLLLVVLFGPPAVVCGVVALCQGHLKGLIGMGLGAAGLTVWGALFFYLFPF